MDRVFIFDVDGTLTQSGQPFDPDFAAFLLTFWPQEKVYLATGTTFEKLQDKIPRILLGSASGLFCCLGNEFVQGGETKETYPHEFPSELFAYVKKLIDLSPFCWRSGNHIGERTGMLNISVAGRDADQAERQRYAEFDAVSHEREYLVSRINRTFPDYEASLGGQISIDVTARGRNKAQVYRTLRRVHPRESFHFFADGLGELGNDRPLAEALEAAGVGHTVHHVTDWRQTQDILSREFVPEFNAAMSA